MLLLQSIPHTYNKTTLVGLETYTEKARDLAFQVDWALCQERLKANERITMKDSSEAGSPGLKFVAISKPGHDWKRGNEYIVRSHVMRHVRKKQKLKVAETQRRLNASSSGQIQRDTRYGKLPISIHGLLDMCLRNISPQNIFNHKSKREAVRESRNQFAALKQGGSSRYLSQERLRYDTPNHSTDLHSRQLSSHHLSAHDHQLLLHISNFYSPLTSNISKKFVLWTKGVKQ
jgi:hypothetical protein